MSDYIKSTNFTAKDSLPSGDSNKIVKGTEIDVEFNAIASAVSSKADINSPTFTGTPAAPTASAGTSTTQVATTAFVNAERSNTATLTNKTINGSSNTITNVSLTTGVTGTLPVANGGTGVTTKTGTGSVVLSADPALTGNPTAPTQSAGNNSTRIATTAFVTTAVAASFPSGGIIMWSGSIASIPSGWYLCNGANGTPDLRDRFVIGAGNTYSVAGTGGSKDAIVVSHTHTATSTVTDPGHSHLADNGSKFVTFVTSGGYDSTDGGTSKTDEASTEIATTGITVSTSVASSGSSGTNANLPPYYALAFIMKA